MATARAPLCVRTAIPSTSPLLVTHKLHGFTDGAAMDIPVATSFCIFASVNLEQMSRSGILGQT